MAGREPRLEHMLVQGIISLHAKRHKPTVSFELVGKCPQRRNMIVGFTAEDTALIIEQVAGLLTDDIGSCQPPFATDPDAV